MSAGPLPGTEQRDLPAGAVAVLCNPAAGRGRHAEAVARALELLRGTGREVKVLEAGTREGALLACQQAIADGAGALVTVGGDGTVHLGIQTVAGTGIPFGVVPAGTGNDFATEAGVNADLGRAASAIVTALREGRTRPLDLAHLTGPDGYQAWFAAVLGAGFDALVNERANAMRWPKGRRRYDFAIFAELLGLRPRRYTLTLDGTVSVVDAVLVAVGNGATYGGGMRMCPAASLTDGLLDVVIAGPVSRRTLLRLQPKLYTGQHVSHRQVTSHQVRTVSIEAEGITAYADGERTCPLPITIEARPAALALLV